MIQVRNVPDRVHGILRTRAAKAGMNLSDYLAGELKAIAARPSLEEIFERIAHRGSVQPKEAPAHAVRAERDSR